MIASYLLKVRLPAPSETITSVIMVTPGEPLPVARLNAYNTFGADRVIAIDPVIQPVRISAFHAENAGSSPAGIDP